MTNFVNQNNLEKIKKLNSKLIKNELSTAEMQAAAFNFSSQLNSVFRSLGKLKIEEREFFDDIVLELVKHLKILCSKGREFQSTIADSANILSTIKTIINKNPSEISRNIQIKTFQLVANLCVDNIKTQEVILNLMGNLITSKLECQDKDFVNVAAMIMHCMILSKHSNLNQLEILGTSLDHFKRFLEDPSSLVPDFVHILLDLLICTSDNAMKYFQQLDAEHQKIALFYIHDYVDIESNEIINTALLKHISNEFKLKSDCILKTVPTHVESIDPQIVVTMLDIVSSASAQGKYLTILKDDRSLFLNLGCLLQIIHKIGKKSDTAFSPIQKLEALVPNTNENGDFEKEFSYAFKTKLVKSLAFLAHKNQKNQELAREMEIMQSIFECTNADARNPLIKEWSILAIRNICEGNLENQEMIKGLTKLGDAENPLLKEMGLDSGMLRIGK